MNLLSYFWPAAPVALVYMLQQVEYNPRKFLAWALHFPDVRRVRHRGSLTKTAAAKGLLLIAYAAWAGTLLLGLGLAVWLHSLLWLLLVLLAPLATVIGLFLATILLKILMIDRQWHREITQARKKLETMPAQRIAVLGSYGKTTMKELLQTVLSQGRNVAATPGNKNVLISHARWVNKQLDGQEEVVIFEYGESEPGDIVRLAGFSQPHFAFVTGLAPAHLDGYSSVAAIAKDLASIQGFVPSDKCYVNGEVSDLSVIKGHHYSRRGVDQMHVSDVKTSVEGTDFRLSLGDKTLQLHTGLLGEHQVGPLAAVVSLAMIMGLSDEQIIAGVAATQPFEHRMQPRPLAGGWLIDDTYNGNIEGMRAGLTLLQQLEAKRKIYVTPGLVDQGVETERVHNELGRLIAEASPDRVVLMQNSVTGYIQAGLRSGKYSGEVVIEPNPLDFYTNLEHLMAAGDLVLMQNDWPDSYK